MKENLEGIEIFGFATDVSEQRQIEKALRESEEKFRALVESTSDWIWEVDVNGRYTYSSPQVFSILGYNAENMIGKSYFDFLPAKNKASAINFFQNAVRKKKAFRCFRKRNSTQKWEKSCSRNQWYSIF